MRSNDVIDQINAEMGGKLKYCRILSGLSQKEFGEMMYVSTQQTQKYEKGTNRISAARLYLLSKKLNFDVNLFFEEIDEGEGKKERLFYRGIIKRVLLLKKKEHITIVQSVVDQFIKLEASYEYKVEKGN